MCNMQRGGARVEGRGDFRGEGLLYRRKVTTLVGRVRVRVKCDVCNMQRGGVRVWRGGATLGGEGLGYRR